MTSFSPAPDPRAKLKTQFELADRQCRAGRLDEAAATYRTILAMHPDLAEVHFALANVLGGQGKSQAAVAELAHALALRPRYAEAHNSLGLILRNQGKLDEAVAHLENALALRPEYAEACNNLGAVHAAQGRLDLAAARFRQAIELAPRHAEAYNNLAAILEAQGQREQAATQLEQAVCLFPGYVDAHDNLGHVRWRQGDLPAAAAQFRRVVALRPGHAKAHANLGSVLWMLNRRDEAIAAYEQSLALVPSNAEAQYTLATCYLAKGDFERGWSTLEARLRVAGAGPLPNLPRWQGQPWADRRLLLVAEEGLGDTLQLVRYARLLKAQGAALVLAVQPQLCRLLAAHPDLDEVCPLGSSAELPAADFYLPLFSAPGVFQTTLATIPNLVPYLWPDPELVDRWRQELVSLAGFKVGIVWQVAHDLAPPIQRSVALTHFAPLAQVPGVQLISLQKGAGSEQVSQANFPVLDFGDRLDAAAGAFMDTAAIIANLDLVVSVDTAVAHLAGALGAPVFVALSLAGDWRWLDARDDSPWYPTMRLFRQTTLGDWNGVFPRIAQAVGESRAQRV